MLEMKHKKILKLKDYCQIQANYITENDSIADKYAKMAYNDVICYINKIINKKKKSNEK